MKEMLTGFMIALVLTPLVIKLNILDHPNNRKIHEQPIPKAGGLAIYAALLIAAYLFNQLNSNISFLFLCTFAIVLGLSDDLREIKKGSTKLLFQSIIAVTAVFLGFKFQLPNTIAAYVVSFLWIISYLNAFNLIDGMDGLAGGVGLIQLVYLSTTAIIMNFQHSITMIVLIFMGAIIAFLLFNFNPAKIFLGDAGSMLIGLFIALFSIKLQANISGHWFNQLAGIGLVTGFPIFDTVQTVVRRIRYKMPLMTADRSHTYNLLVDEYGLSTKQTVSLIYLVCILMGFIGVSLFQMLNFWTGLLSLAAIVSIGVTMLTRRMGTYSSRERNY